MKLMKLKRKINDYLYGKFLPAVTRKAYEEEIQSLRKAFDAQQQKIAQLNAYINGINDTMHMYRAKIDIKNEVNSSEH